MLEHGLHRTPIALAIVLAARLDITDITTVNVAPPTIKGSLGENIEDAPWFSKAYLIAVKFALPILPRLKNLCRRRR